LDPNSTAPIIILFVLVLLHAFFAAGQVAIISIRKSRLNQLIEEGRREAAWVASLAEEATRLLATTELVLKLLSFLAVALIASVYAAPVASWLSGFNPPWPVSFSHSAAIGLITLGLVLLVLIFGELIPKEIAAHNPEPFALWAVYPMRAVAFVASPLARAVVAASRLLTGLSGETPPGLPFITEEEIKTLVDAGEEGGVIEEDEKRMIYSIFEFGDTLAREVMVPRIDIVAVDVNSRLSDALAVIIQAGHSRIPVYAETIDNIVGILYAKDLLRYWCQPGNDELDDLKLRDILRDVFYVPETKKVDELLQELQKRKVHIAVVVDEYGGTAGLVTIEDILEEIVGEIQDEYDTDEEAFVEVISPDEAIFNGRVAVDDVNQTMDVELPTDSGDTLGGLIYSSLGRVPVAGDEARVRGVELSVLAVAGRRIKKVKVTRVAGGGGPPVEGGASSDDSRPVETDPNPSQSKQGTIL
jgi:magnesium and cobalt exporter, CNNM family